jgi:hypothetical protein
MNLAQLFRMGAIHKGYMSPVGESGGGDGATGGADDGADNGGDNGGKDEQSGSESDGKPTLSDKEAELVREVMQKKEKIETLATTNEQIKSELNELKAKFDGIDPEAFKQMQRDNQERRERELENNQDWATLKAEMEERFESERQQIIEQNRTGYEQKINEHQTEAQKLQQQLEQSNALIEELTVGNEFGQSQFIAKHLAPSTAKIRKLYGEHFEVEDGKVVAYDKPRGAEKRHPLINGDGKPLNFDLALQKIVDSDPDKDTILKATQQSGSDSGSNNRNGQAAESDLRGVARIERSLSKQGR